MRGATAIVGAGSTGVGRYGDRTAISLADEAVAAALEDCGLDRSAIDGLVVHIGWPRGADYDETANLLGLNVQFGAQSWSHGRFGATVIQHAAMAVACGLADHVLCIAAYKNSNLGQIGGRDSFGFHETLRHAGGPHAETPHAGLNGPVASAAMAAQRYFHVYGQPLEKLAAVPIAMRAHARRNEQARMRKPMAEDEYFAAPFIVEPLRLLDCSVVVDGAVALVVTRADRARDQAHEPVYLMGFQGLSAGPQEFIFGQPGLGLNTGRAASYQPPGADQPVYRMAGVVPSQIDLLQVYDAFSPLVLFALERLGFCGAGEAPDFVAGGRIGPGGELPVNTGGGMLSEGHLNGWSQFYEIVKQLRGTAGGTQVAGAALAQWGTALGDSIVFAAPHARDGLLS